MLFIYINYYFNNLCLFTKVGYHNGKKIESKQIITRRQYDQYRKYRDDTRNEVDVRRTCFMYEDTYFEGTF